MTYPILGDRKSQRTHEVNIAKPVAEFTIGNSGGASLIFNDVSSLTGTLTGSYDGKSWFNVACTTSAGAYYAAGSTITAVDGQKINFDAPGLLRLRFTYAAGAGAVTLVQTFSAWSYLCSLLYLIYTTLLAPISINDTAGQNNVVVTSIVPGTAATSLGKAEDSAHTSADVGVMALGIQKATPADISTEGDYTPLQLSGGRLWASIIAKLNAVSNVTARATGTNLASSATEITSDFVVTANAGYGILQIRMLSAANTIDSCRIRLYRRVGTGPLQDTLAVGGMDWTFLVLTTTAQLHSVELGPGLWTLGIVVTDGGADTLDVSALLDVY